MSNRVARGPKWAQIPFYNIDRPFWPDKALLLEEAIAVRHLPDNRIKYDVGLKHDRGTVTMDWQFSHNKTPVLNQHFDNFVSRYGDFGKTLAHYFYIDAGADYEWHADNNVPGSKTEWGKHLPVNCCINVVLTEDDSECEFLGIGKFKYKAGVLNTSHMHRVKPDTMRILARISFLDAIYEEVVYRIRKVDMQHNQ